MTSTADAGAELARLLAIMERLRDPEGGCPWDRRQDFASIAPYTLEEAYEVADAIARGDREHLREELGDLLFQVVFHAQMAREAGWFDFAAVAQGIGDKLVRRHPHVFGDAEMADAEAQSHAWEAHKAAERAARGGAEARLLDDIPLALPALVRAAKLQKRAARVGFDWPAVEGVLDKIGEELGELRRALAGEGGPTAVAEELGDLLFAVVNLARHVRVDPEDALRTCNDKFTGRFRYMEDRLRAAGRHPEDASLAELDALWEEAKAAGR